MGNEVHENSGKEATTYFEEEVVEIRRSTLFQPSGQASSEAYLLGVIQEVGQARSYFMNDVRQLTLLIVGLFVALGGLVSYASAQAGGLGFAAFAAVLLLLILILFVFRAAYEKLSASYEFYVSSVIHAALLHAAAGIRLSHFWFCHLQTVLKQTQVLSVGNWKRDVINQWMEAKSELGEDKDNLYVTFKRLLRVADLLTLIAYFGGCLAFAWVLSGMDFEQCPFLQYFVCS